ncbi:MAG: hypothetical protein GY926_14130 [bacterium]|nr:hypothetical protein [bacterium]MCP4966357.1 hypothetical protein [bacterium]
MPNPGTKVRCWLLDVQTHGTYVDEDTTTVPGTTIKREDGRLMLLRIPGSQHPLL